MPYSSKEISCLPVQATETRKKIQKTWVYNGNINIMDNNGKNVKISHITELIKYGVQIT